MTTTLIARLGKLAIPEQKTTTGDIASEAGAKNKTVSDSQTADVANSPAATEDANTLADVKLSQPNPLSSKQSFVSPRQESFGPQQEYLRAHPDEVAGLKNEISTLLAECRQQLLPQFKQSVAELTTGSSAKAYIDFERSGVLLLKNLKLALKSFEGIPPEQQVQESKILNDLKDLIAARREIGASFRSAQEDVQKREIQDRVLAEIKPFIISTATAVVFPKYYTPKDAPAPSPEILAAEAEKRKFTDKQQKILVDHYLNLLVHYHDTKENPHFNRIVSAGDESSLFVTIKAKFAELCDQQTALIRNQATTIDFSTRDQDQLESRLKSITTSHSGVIDTAQEVHRKQIGTEASFFIEKKADAYYCTYQVDENKTSSITVRLFEREESEVVKLFNRQVIELQESEKIFQGGKTIRNLDQFIKLLGLGEAIDLQGFRIKGANLVGIDLERKNLKDVTFEDCTMSAASMAWARSNGTRLINCRTSGIDTTGSKIILTSQTISEKAPAPASEKTPVAKPAESLISRFTRRVENFIRWILRQPPREAASQAARVEAPQLAQSVKSAKLEYHAASLAAVRDILGSSYLKNLFRMRSLRKLTGAEIEFNGGKVIIEAVEGDKPCCGVRVYQIVSGEYREVQSAAFDGSPELAVKYVSDICRLNPFANATVNSNLRGKDVYLQRTRYFPGLIQEVSVDPDAEDNTVAVSFEQDEDIESKIN